MDTLIADPLARAKDHITDWIDGLQVAGSRLGHTTRQELLTQLASARPTTRTDGTVELVLPGLSSLGLGIFQRSFRMETVLIRVVPYGLA
ncbi:MAG: hypothetical protein ABIS92_04245 [Polyangia bacterium]